MSQRPNPGQDVQLSNVSSSGDDNTATSSNHVFAQDGLHADSHWVFTPRHVTMNTIGGAVGTGLMIGTGYALSKAGPAALVISHTAVGFIVFMVLCALGEMAVWLPVPDTFTGHASRFCHPALGFTLGWIYLFKHLVATPNQLTAGALVMSYWLSSDRVSPAVWITVFLVIIVFANWFAVRFLGEFEFWLSSFKIAVIAGLMVLSLVLALGGGPDRDRKGFRYWKQPGSFAIAGDGSNGHVKRLSAVWKTLPSTTFAYIGTELIVRITSYRILVFHILSAILLGMIVPYNCERLAFASHASESAPASAFVAAIEIAGIAVLPDLLNACILVFVLAAANSSLFMAVRTIYGLSRENQAPALFSRTDRRGIPIYSLGACSLLASLAFMSTSENSKIVFGYFVNLVTILGLLIWISVLITHISFIRARKAQKVPDEALAFKAPLGSCGSWAALISCVTISLTKSVDLFNGNEFPGGFDYVGFITSYLGIPLYLGLLIGYKMATKCKRVRSVEVDLSTGKYEFDIREADNPENVEARGHPQDGPSSWLDRIVKYVK